MEKDFSKWKSSAEKGGFLPSAFAFSFYHKYDMAHLKCEYTSGFGYKARVSPKKLDNTVSGKVEKHQALRIAHYDHYRHLGNAWTTAQKMLRSHRNMPSKTIPLYEIYGGFPGEVDEKDILITIHIPLR
jgi:hypothetical protein